MTSYPTDGTAPADQPEAGDPDPSKPVETKPISDGSKKSHTDPFHSTNSTDTTS